MESKDKADESWLEVFQYLLFHSEKYSFAWFLIVAVVWFLLLFTVEEKPSTTHLPAKLRKVLCHFSQLQTMELSLNIFQRYQKKLFFFLNKNQCWHKIHKTYLLTLTSTHESSLLLSFFLHLALCFACVCTSLYQGITECQVEERECRRKITSAFQQHF